MAQSSASDFSPNENDHKNEQYDNIIQFWKRDVGYRLNQ